MDLLLLVCVWITHASLCISHLKLHLLYRLNLISKHIRPYCNISDGNITELNITFGIYNTMLPYAFNILYTDTETTRMHYLRIKT